MHVGPQSSMQAGRDCPGAIRAMENDLAEPRRSALLSMLKSVELLPSFLSSCEAWQKTQVLHARPIPFPRGAEGTRSFEVAQQTLTMMNINYSN